MDSMDLSRPVFLSYVIIRQFPVRAAFNPDELQSLDTEQKKPTLLNLVQQWLERTPGLEGDEFNFPFQYRKAVDKYLQARKDSIKVYRKHVYYVHQMFLSTVQRQSKGNTDQETELLKSWEKDKVITMCQSMSHLHDVYIINIECF